MEFPPVFRYIFKNARSLPPGPSRLDRTCLLWRALMLTLLGSGSRFCDGVSRRSFLKVGALGLGGLTLPDLLRCDAASGKARSHKSVIMVYLSGGLAHQDSFDLKPHAPAEVKGEFKPIPS